MRRTRPRAREVLGLPAPVVLVYPHVDVPLAPNAGAFGPASTRRVDDLHRHRELRVPACPVVDRLARDLELEGDVPDTDQPLTIVHANIVTMLLSRKNGAGLLVATKPVAETGLVLAPATWVARRGAPTTV